MTELGGLQALVDDAAMPVALARDGERSLDGVADLAAALGGGLTAARERDGFRVQAWLPTEDQPPSPAVPTAAP